MTWSGDAIDAKAATTSVGTTYVVTTSVGGDAGGTAGAAGGAGEDARSDESTVGHTTGVGDVASLSDDAVTAPGVSAPPVLGQPSTVWPNWLQPAQRARKRRPPVA